MDPDPPRPIEPPGQEGAPVVVLFARGAPAAVAARAEEHGGYVVKTTGGAWMIAFSEPSSALAFAGALTTEHPEVAIGAELGPVVATADPLHGRADYFGTTVNVTARLAEAAHPGQVVVGDRLRAHGAAGFLDLGWHRLRGLRASFHLHQLGDRAFPPLATASPPTNLAPSVDSFVGREAERARIGAALADGARLLTLVGPAGAGKTRLAREAAAAQLAAWPGGVWFFALAEARSAAALAEAVAQGLDARLDDDDPVEVVGDALAGRGPVLLVLDNAEQVADELAAALVRWLERAPEVRALVTSRRPLGVPGEQPIPVEPLPVDEGVALFVARASAVAPGFVATPGPIRALVAALDGLPLAIELAAARAHLLTPTTMHQRLSDRFRLFRTQRRDLPPRQATLWAAIDWSWDLLDAHERKALTQLSVFEGGFTLEAARHVLAGLDAPALVAGLVRHSLVRSDPETGRYGLLVTIQEYARARLDAADRATAERRHAAFFARAGTPEALDSLCRRDGPDRRRALVDDLENLRAAALRGPPAEAGAAALATWAVLRVLGPFGTAAAWLAERAEREGLPADVRLDLRLATVEAWVRAGQADRAVPLIAEVEAEAEANGDRLRVGKAHLGRGNVATVRSALQEATEAFRAALEELSAAGDTLTEGVVLGNLGVTLATMGDIAGGERCYRDALALHRSTGNREHEGMVLGNLANLLGDRGDLEAAREHYTLALEAAREVGNRRSEAVVLGNLGVLHADTGDFEGALRCYQSANALYAETGGRWNQLYNELNLGEILIDLGRQDEAEAALDRVLASAAELAARGIEAMACTHLATLYRRQSRLAEARSHLDRADALMRHANQPLELAKVVCQRGLVDAAEGRLHEARQAFEEARSLTPDLGQNPELARLLDELAAATA